MDEEQLPAAVVIAERVLLCAPRDEPERQVLLRVHAPVVQGRGWICEAELVNLFEDRARAEGVDSLQALQLALTAVHNALEQMIRSGGTVCWADGSPFQSVDDLRL